MTKKILALLSIVAYCHLVAEDVVSKSFLSLRPRFELNLPERLSLAIGTPNLWSRVCAPFRTRMDTRENGHGAALQAVAMYAKTSNSAGMARYFLPNGKDSILVGEDASNSAVSRTRDVNAFHLGILTAPLTQAQVDGGFTLLTFESQLNLCPQQSLSGLGFTYQQRLPNRFWFDIAAPVMHVKNTLGLTEHIFNYGGQDVPTEYFGTVLSALGDCNADRHYGRLTTKTMCKTRLAFIEARVGRDIRWEDFCLIGGFGGIIIPTGNKPCGTYLFEPIVGNNGHFGVMMGSYGIFEIMRDRSDRTLSAQYNIVTRYLISNNQTRSFDLRGKPWSRYMRVWANDNYGLDLASSEWQSRLDYLINYSTLCVRVKPDANIDINANLNYKDRNLDLEFGYNAYARKAENIYFTHAIKGNIGLPALRWYLDGNHVPATESKATINTPLFKINPGYADQIINPAGQESTTTMAYLPITTDDLDPSSGARPACLAYQVHGALGYEWNKCKYPTLINGGVSYEFSYDNTFINRWLVWFKVGISI